MGNDTLVIFYLSMYKVFCVPCFIMKFLIFSLFVNLYEQESHSCRARNSGREHKRADLKEVILIWSTQFIL